MIGFVALAPEKNIMDACSAENFILCNINKNYMVYEKKEV